MAVGNLVRSLQNIMRQDAGINGDAQRIEQMVWMMFLKVYDAQEEDWELDDEDYQSIIPEPLRWRNWAPHKDAEGRERKDAMTGEELIFFVEQKLFRALKGNDVIDRDGNVEIKGIKVNRRTERCKAIVHEVFSEVNQYMKNGVLLRQMVNAIDDIDLMDSAESHAFGDIYENILKDLQNAGNAGEFYTPRALTDFIVAMLNPRLGEKFGDFAGGTGGFCVSALKHLEKQKKTARDEELFQQSVIGQEWKPFPYLLAVTNLLLHGIRNPEYYHMDSLGVPMSEYHSEGKVDVIGMNPPYGGATDATTKQNFKQEFRSSETADLFLVLIMERLARGGRAGVIVPDGFLFGADGAKLAIKQRLLRDFNLHTIIRLPESIFNPYTSIATNILFFNNEKAEGAAEGFSTKETWFYRLDMPEGYKNFSKTKPMKVEHCQPIADWWSDRKEIISDVLGEKSRRFPAEELMAMEGNFDLCKFPKEEEEVLPPDELLREYHDRRNELESEIADRLYDIEKLIHGSEVDSKQFKIRDPWKELAEITMALPDRLRKSVLQEAIQGRLVPQDPDDEPASVLLAKIRKEKERLVKEGKLKKKDLVTTPISDEEKPFDIPEGWKWCRIEDVFNVIMGQSPDGSSINNSMGVEFHQGKVAFTEYTIAKSGFYTSNPSKIAKAGSLLVCVRAPIGNVNYCDREICIGRGLCALKEYGNMNITLWFYFLTAIKPLLESKGTGSTFKAITAETLKTQVVPLPPLAEQHRIVEKLEEILKKIDNLR